MNCRIIPLLVLLAIGCALQTVQSQTKSQSNNRGQVDRQETSKRTKFALLVGVRDYADPLAPLKFTENDAESLALVFEKAGYEVKVLTTTRGEKDRKQAPTAANVRAAAKWLFEKRTRHDVILLGLAGHGVQLEVKDNNGKNPKSFPMFCPADANLKDIEYETGKSATLINLDQLVEDMGASGAGAKLLLVDACRNDVQARNVQTQTRNVNTKKVNVPRGVSALFSCDEGQCAFETAKLGKGHGVFFHHVIEALRGAAKDKDDNVTWDDMSSYVRTNVAPSVEKLVGGGAKQTPHALNNVAGAPVVLVSRPEIPPTELAVGQVWTGKLKQSGEYYPVRLVFTGVNKDKAIAIWRGTTSGGYVWRSFDLDLHKEKNGTREFDVVVRDLNGAPTTTNGKGKLTGMTMEGSFKFAGEVCTFAFEGANAVKTKHGVQTGQIWVGTNTHNDNGRPIVYDLQVYVIEADDAKLETFYILEKSRQKQYFIQKAELKEDDENWRYSWTSHYHNDVQCKDALASGKGKLDTRAMKFTGEYENPGYQNQGGTVAFYLPKKR